MRSIGPDDFLRGLFYFLREAGQAGFRQLYPFTENHGVGCGLFTFIPEKYVFIWILSSIPFYIYLFCSYMNYMLSYERVETALETEEMPETTRQNQPAYFAEIEKRLTEWTGKDGYTRPGLTIGELAGTLGTNRTYLADYIKSVYHVTFREWMVMMQKVVGEISITN